MASFAPMMPIGLQVEDGPKDKIHIILNKDVYFDNDTIMYGVWNPVWWSCSLIYVDFLLYQKLCGRFGTMVYVHWSQHVSKVLII